MTPEEEAAAAAGKEDAHEDRPATAEEKQRASGARAPRGGQHTHYHGGSGKVEGSITVGHEDADKARQTFMVERRDVDGLPAARGRGKR